MKTPVLVTAFATMLALSSCGGDGHHSGMPHGGESGQHAGEPGSGLRLDGGKKWQANEATHAGMERMARLLADFRASGAEDYAALGSSLQKEATTIVRKCTMTGEAHDQLHLLLNPMLEDIDALATGSGGEEECDSLREHLEDYRAHFER